MKGWPENIRAEKIEVENWLEDKLDLKIKLVRTWAL